MTATADRPQQTVLGPHDPHPRRRAAFVVMMAAAIMDLVDASVVNVALPTLRMDLGASYAETQWITAGYTLTFGLALITGGRLGDRYGRKKVFLHGIVAFTVASALCGLAVNPEMLVVSRILQGAASALMMPQIVAFVVATFPLHERGRTMGTYGAITGVAAVVGPILGGVLLTYGVFDLGWRAIFLINIPIGVLAFIATVVVVPETRSPFPLRMDIIGVVLITATLVLVLYPLVQGSEAGWPQWTVLAMLGSPLVLVVYALHARRKQRGDGAPLVPLGLFAAPGFAVGTIVIILFDVCLIGYCLMLSLSVQLGLEFSAIHSGLMLVPLAVGAGLAASQIDRLLAVLGRHLISIGSTIMGIGIACTAIVVHAGSDMWDLWPVTFVVGAGLGLVIGPAATVASSAVRQGDAGAASGTLNAAGQIGSAIGAALLSVTFFGVLDPTIGRAESFLTGLRSACWWFAACTAVIAALAQFLPRRVAGYPSAH